jgi:hypothetical protein
MNIIEAVKLIKLDKNIKLKRRSKEITLNLHLFGNHIMKDDICSMYLREIDDILAEDWYVVKDEKLHTFEEAIVAYKAGKTIQRQCHKVVRYNLDYDNFYFLKDDIIANDWIIKER